ncbi:MAG: mannose-1-phosphate guanylyltransferase [Candidatus Kerfeldbacteria bacterium]|nr:mannose-1-phosphate guanylyltransferase [Candidatus Kerfeldbacteria bacterium]
MKPVIFAGGSGTRLWPLSRQQRPKQAHPFGDNESLLQKTYSRLRRGWPASSIYLSTGRRHYALLRRQLPRLERQNFILEPSGRDTAAAIGLAATVIARRNPREVMVTVWSDAYVRETDRYVQLLKHAGQVVKRHPSQTVLIGVKPRYADTGLGYIKMKHEVETIDGADVFLVDRFIEKPNRRRAERFVASWQYLWNPGIYVFRADAMLDKFRRWLNPSYRILTKIAAALGTAGERAAIDRWFPKLQRISIDFGIMEHDRTMLVIPADLTWSDIGSWRELYHILAADGRTLVLRGHHLERDSRGNLVYTSEGKVVATVGLEQMIVVDTPDALLICPRDRAQEVKRLVQELERRSLHRYL